ncbi:MAG: multicopper oxidase domain-containing protein [Acidimicrobiia bacterium]
MSIDLRDHEETAARDGWMVLVMTFSAFAMIVMLFAAGVAVRGGDGDDGAPVATDTVEVTLGDLFVEPAGVTMPAGGQLTLHVTNEGAMPHDLKVGGTDGTDMLDPGESATITIGPFDASTEAWCTVPGHREAGMSMSITVEGSGETAVGAGGGAAAPGPSGAEIDFDAEPDADWEPFDPELAPAPGGTEHQVTWHMTEQVMEIAPGVTQQVWTFDGQVPGPTLRGKLGDIFTVTIVNDGEVGHSLDFHASKVAWDDEMRTIEPGESLVYQFEAKHAGAFMYHCGTAPTLHHIGNGMHGAIIIDPPALAPVDHEFVFVQSEWYTGAEGEPGDLGKMQDEAWDAVVFNGYVNQYAHQPIDGIQVGERVRAWVVDSGPSENSSWHVVGTIFDTVFKEGAYQLRPDDSRGGAQALDLQPAQGGFVEFTFDEDGLYPFVTHKFANVGKGALGLFAVGAVDASEAGGH